MKKSHLLGALCAVAFGFISLPSTVASVIIDFQSVATNASVTTYSEDGFTLTGSFFLNTNVAGGNPGPRMDVGTTFSLGASDGSAFNLLGFDAREAILFDGGSTWRVTGIFDAGGSIIQDFNVSSSYQTFTPSGFEKLTSVSFSPLTEGSLAAFDNFEVEAVPIPAAVWLFGSGLLGLVGIARRKKAA